MQKIQYFLKCTRKRLIGEGLYCPSCGCSRSQSVSQKYWVTELRRCNDCLLLFRTPATSDNENRSFYQKSYRQGFTTDMPDENRLAVLKSTKFKGTEKDYSRFLAVLNALGIKRGSRLLDFGCSWGYGSWQFAQNGFEVESYEISEPRRRYAIKNLECTVHSRFADITPGFDVFFSSHVLEHVPSPKNVIELALSVVKPGGVFIAFTPNGAAPHRAKEPAKWQKLWGLVHPNFLDDQYYRLQFAAYPYLLASDPYDLNAIKSWDASKQRQRVLDLSGPELLCIVRIERPQLQENSALAGEISQDDQDIQIGK